MLELCVDLWDYFGEFFLKKVLDFLNFLIVRLNILLDLKFKKSIKKRFKYYLIVYILFKKEMLEIKYLIKF